MDLDELDAALEDARDVLRVETLDAYAARADGGDVDRYQWRVAEPFATWWAANA